MSERGILPNINRSVWRKALLPVSWLYGFGIRLRNALFDMGILPSETSSIPVISIGNLTVGGTGKTPHTEALASELLKHFNVAILSRGYKRISKGFQWVEIDSKANFVGDEPLQMKRKLPQVIVAVDANRRRGIHTLLDMDATNRPQVILLDDAFQHRYVSPSLSILLMDYNRMIQQDHLLPAGELREPASSYKRADLLIVTKCPETLQPIDLRMLASQFHLLPHQQLFFTKMRYRDLTPVFPSAPAVSLTALKQQNRPVLLVTGIANPKPLLDYLQSFGLSVRSLPFTDHHVFTKNDIQKITKAFSEHSIGGSGCILTTEKDAVRMQENPDFTIFANNLYYIGIGIDFLSNQADEFHKKLLQHVENHT